MELLAATAARVQDDEDSAWIVPGKQGGPGQRFTGAGNFKRQALTDATVFTDTFVRQCVPEAAGFERVRFRSTLLSLLFDEGESAVGLVASNERKLDLTKRGRAARPASVRPVAGELARRRAMLAHTQYSEGEEAAELRGTGF